MAEHPRTDSETTSRRCPVLAGLPGGRRRPLSGTATTVPRRAARQNLPQAHNPLESADFLPRVSRPCHAPSAASTQSAEGPDRARALTSVRPRSGLYRRAPGPAAFSPEITSEGVRVEFLRFLVTVNIPACFAGRVVA
jgi:hypothetical protein